MQPEQRVEAIRAKLEQDFKPQVLEIEDKSHEHAGHKSADGKGHYQIHIKAKTLDDLSLLQKHRAIYKSLDDLIQTDIHALSIKT